MSWSRRSPSPPTSSSARPAPSRGARERPYGSSIAGSAVTSQLLIDMPAEGAARLLTLSLIERLTQYSAAMTRNGEPPRARPQVASYRTTVRRLRAGMTLYGSALGSGVPRKARRRLGDLADAAERLHRAEVQIAWAARLVPPPEQRLAGEPLGDG